MEINKCPTVQYVSMSPPCWSPPLRSCSQGQPCPPPPPPPLTRDTHWQPPWQGINRINSSQSHWTAPLVLATVSLLASLRRLQLLPQLRVPWELADQLLPVSLQGSSSETPAPPPVMSPLVAVEELGGSSTPEVTSLHWQCPHYLRCNYLEEVLSPQCPGNDWSSSPGGPVGQRQMDPGGQVDYFTLL